MVRFAEFFPARGSACLDRNDFIHMIIFRRFGVPFFQAICNQRLFLRSLYTKRKEINPFLSDDKTVLSGKARR